MDTQWKVSGTYFEACNCNAACPCPFLGAPTEGSCTALVAWHIDEGRFEGASLNGLNAVLAAWSPGSMMDGNWKVALYLDERADAPQKDALAKIFSGEAGGHLGALAPLISEVLGVKSVPIAYKAEGRERSMEIPGIAAADIAAIEGQGGKEITISNPAFAPVPDQAMVASRSRSASYDDFGLRLDVNGKNGFYSPFVYQAA